MSHKRIIKINMIGNKLPKNPEHENYHCDHKSELYLLYKELLTFSNLNCVEYEQKYKNYIRVKSKYSNCIY